MELRDSVVLATGGSRGIGRPTSELLAGRGAEVVDSGRDQDALHEVAARIGGTPIVLDLREETAPAALVDEALDRCGRLDAVVSNAGIGFAGPLVTVPLARIAELVDVDLRAPLLLSRSALEAFRLQASAGDRRERGLVFVTSIAGLVGAPGERASTPLPKRACRPSPRCCARRCAPIPSSPTYTSPRWLPGSSPPRLRPARLSTVPEVSSAA